MGLSVRGPHQTGQLLPPSRGADGGGDCRGQHPSKDNKLWNQPAWAHILFPPLLAIGSAKPNYGTSGKLLSLCLGFSVIIVGTSLAVQWQRHLCRGLSRSRHVMSNSLRPHGLQHTRLPCPSPPPGVCPSSCLLNWWCHPTISSSAAHFSCPPSFPASRFFPVSRFFLAGR